MEKVKDLKELLSLICMPNEMASKVLSYDKIADYEAYAPEFERMHDRKTWEDARLDLKKKLGDDPEGVKILTCQLHEALPTWNKLLERGISKDIMIATLKAFVRYMTEHKVSYGYYGYDRDYWTQRHVAGQLFRIGELE